MDLDDNSKLKDVIDYLKITFGHVNVAIGCESTLNTTIKTVAVCAGSGGSVLKGVLADLYVTG